MRAERKPVPNIVKPSNLAIEPQKFLVEWELSKGAQPPLATRSRHRLLGELLGEASL